MTSLALIFTLACIGISETMYLVRKRIASERPICPIGGGCEIVLTSRYNKMFFLPNDLLGLLAYIAIATLSAFLVIPFGPIILWQILLLLLVTISTLASTLFIFLQWKVIRAWCFWCVMSASTIFLMAIIILINLIQLILK